MYLLQGEVVLRTDGGEQVLTAGMCAGFVAGSADGHQLINRGSQPALYLVALTATIREYAKYVFASRASSGSSTSRNCQTRVCPERF